MDLHPNVVEALKALEESREAILKANADAVRVTEILGRHPQVTPSMGMVQMSGCIAYTLLPESMDALTALVRDLRAAFPDGEYDVRQMPEEGSILYYIGPCFFRATLLRKCTFKKKGTETVERPVYELVCE